MTAPHIGTLSEQSLHAALKQWLARPGDQLEVPLEGYVIDVVHDDLLLEVQTRHLYALKTKLRKLLRNHSVQLFHPISAARWIVRQDAAGRQIGRRKSPLQGQPADIFRELVRMTPLLSHPRLTVSVLLIQEEQIWRDDGLGSWRRKHWSIVDRRLLAVDARHDFTATTDWLRLLPAGLPPLFTNRDLADRLRCRPQLAGQISYTLRKLDLVEVVGKQGNAHQMRVVAGGSAA